MSTQKITCPNCKTEFAIEDALAENLEKQYQDKYRKQLNAWLSKHKAEEEALQKEREKLEQQKRAQQAAIEERVNKRLREEQQRIEKETRENYNAQIKKLKDELNKSRHAELELQQKELDLQKLRHDMKTQEQRIRLQMEKELLNQRDAMEKEARARMQEEYAMKEREYQKQLDDQKRMLEEMRRKASQGSMQMQGEVQELAIEDLLKQEYPFDTIQEVGKGQRGADCLQTVINNRGQKCGIIVYESKRTKNFSDKWIEKLKADRQNSKADIAVLVTRVFPKDMTRFGLKNGVWVCHFTELKSVSLVLREMLIKTQAYRAMQENKGEKMEMLYAYLTSAEFAHTVEQLVSTYQAMQEQLQKEKRAIQKQWALREKQIETMQQSSMQLFGSIQGIAGKSLKGFDPLALLEGDE
ncbi:MAG: DUF2130 domain-containing protein [Calditrichaeota bacterium]|nr:MAG: DUF2130 domain-containing protein [Calditrichota bacterium]